MTICLGDDYFSLCADIYTFCLVIFVIDKMFRDSIYLSELGKDSSPSETVEAPSSNVSDRRAQLLKRKVQGPIPNQTNASSNTFRARLEAEIMQYKATPPIDIKMNPLDWWKQNCGTYPLLAKFVKSNGAFQATSVASERIFNVDKLVYDDKRKRLDVERGSGLVIAQDYLKRRKNQAEFRLCPDCPAPQSEKGQPKYRINCAQHAKLSASK